MHGARIDRHGGKITYNEALESLPSGAFVQIGNSSLLVWDGKLLLWSPEGYQRADQRPCEAAVTVLTPEPIVQCLREGYAPVLHESARMI